MACVCFVWVVFVRFVSGSDFVNRAGVFNFTQDFEMTVWVNGILALRDPEVEVKKQKVLDIKKRYGF